MQGPTREDSAILENCGRVTEYEINSSEYLWLTVELTATLRVKCVLMSSEAAAVDHRLIGVDHECHGLTIRCSGCILNPQVAGDEANTSNSFLEGKKKS